MGVLFHTDTATMQEAAAFFREKLTLGIECNKLTEEDELYLTNLLAAVLEETGKKPIFEYISYIYRELINNAKKANMKRLYFETIGFDIDNPRDYSAGMQDFKDTLAENVDSYTETLEERGFYIKTSYLIENDTLVVSVANNSTLTFDEKNLIAEKIKNATEFHSIEDAIITVTNNKEGAGLGLIISILMLKKLSLNEHNLIITSDDEATTSTLVIPLSATPHDEKIFIKQTILDEIQDIPQFPDHILQIQEMLQDEELNIKKLSGLVIKDAALAGKIIKFSNSPLYPTYKEIATITDAIKVIGLTGLKNIIYSYGSEQIFNKRYDADKLRYIFDHSNEVARVAFNLGKKKLSRKMLENLYIAALLHDLGRILQTAINEEITLTINRLCHERGVSLSILEELTDGLSHQAIGCELARKWNFPELLIDVIENHHSPQLAKEEHREVVYVVYLADLIVSDNGQLFTSISDEAKRYFHIKTKADLNRLLEKVQ